MKETKRIAALFEALYEGSPWIDVNIKETLEKLPAAKAGKKISPEVNSIWEIVNHILNWRQHVIERVQGKVLVTPGNNYFKKISNQSEKEWQRTLEKLNESQKQWIDLLRNFKHADFNKVYPNNALTYYEHIHGILQHDAYHLGQIKLLIKLPWFNGMQNIAARH